VQGYDSVALRADVELGGTDQKFNLLVGRQLQREYGQEPQVVITMPLLPGTDGVEKMSKSLGNHIGIAEPPEQIFGKVMSIPDAALETYLRLLSDLAPDEIGQRLHGMAAGRVNPVHVKRELGRELVGQYHGPEAGVVAEAAFDRIFVRGELPEDMPELRLEGPTRLIDVIVRGALTTSLAEARRLIRQGAVVVDGAPVRDESAELGPGPQGPRVLKVGKRRFARIVFPPADGA
jgi:tyrosyl-tRNA synthetase